jgi:hypothetical protein
LRLWGHITSYADLRSWWGLKQSCILRRELFNGVSHSTCAHRGWVNSWFLVLGNQIVSLTPNLSFCHNLCYRCPNGSCKPIFDIYTCITFQYIKNVSMQSVLTPEIELWSFRSPGGLPSPHFGSERVILSLFQSRVVTFQNSF